MSGHPEDIPAPQQPAPDRPAAPPPSNGCLVAAIRLPVQILTVITVLPLRLLWDGVSAVARALYRWVLAPVGRALAWLFRILVWTPVRALFVALGWLLHYLLVVPVRWLYRVALTPLGHGLAWLTRILIVVPLAACYTYLLAPVGRAVAWVARITWAGLVLLATAVWRYALGPPLKAVGTLLGWGWQAAGWILRMLWRGISTVFRWLVFAPLSLLWRWVLRPVLVAFHRGIWQPVARIVRGTLREVRTALFGAPAQPPALPADPPADPPPGTD